VIRRLIAEELHVWCDAEPLRLRLQRGPLRTVAGEQQREPGMALAQPGDRVEQQRQAFDGCQAAREEQPRAAAFVGAWREVGGCDAAVHDVHAIPALHRRPDQHLAAAEVADAGDEGGARELGVEPPPFGREEDVRAVLGNAERRAAQLGGQHGDRAARAREVIVQMYQPSLAHAVGHHAGLGEVRGLPEGGAEPRRPRAQRERERSAVATGRCGQQPEMRAEQRHDRGAEHDERACRLFALRVAHALGLVGQAPDGEGLDVRAEPAERRHLAMDEDERGESKILAGEVRDA
jgi:hypothetical protein